MRIVGAVFVFLSTFAIARTAAPRDEDESLVNVGVQRHEGALSEAALKKPLPPRQFLGCRALAAHGEFVVRARIDRRGEVVDARRLRASVDNGPAFRCVLTVVNSATFPKARGETTVDVSVMFDQRICEGPDGRSRLHERLRAVPP